MSSPASEFFRGTRTLPRGVAYLFRHPRLIPWMLAPAVLTITVLLFAVVATVMFGPPLLLWLVPSPANPSWMVWWRLGLGLLTGALIVVAVAAGWVFGNMASAPLYDVIAGSVEREQLGLSEERETWAIAFGNAALSIRHSIVGFGLYVSIMVPLLALNLIPGLGSLLYTVSSFAATVFFVSREIMDVSLSRRQLSFREKLGYLVENRAYISGHSAVVAVFLFIPFANIFVTPLAVLGATLIFCDIESARDTGELA
ncbi:MAG: CysZ protein [Myxococcota bacterium]|jgi:CysZ protein